MNRLIDDDVVEWIKDDSFLAKKTLELYLIGNQKRADQMNDYDFVAFIDDDCSIVEYGEKCISFIHSKSTENNLLINIFPYQLKNKLENSSMFIINVLRNGKKVL
jgi:hypothetical protein